MKNSIGICALLAIGLMLNGCQKESIESFSGASNNREAGARKANGNFSAHLTGDEEVPVPVVTNATGQATFKLSKDGTALTYKLIVANIESVRFGHLHLGAKGANGGVVVDLVGRTEPSPQGVIAEGTITSASLKGALLGKPLSDLINAMENQGVYVNVHSDKFPGGEIRGQVR